jgi:hypothetical protein
MGLFSLQGAELRAQSTARDANSRKERGDAVLTTACAGMSVREWVDPRVLAMDRQRKNKESSPRRERGL